MKIMDTEWLKSQIDKIRAEASRGAVPPSISFNLTDPIMDRIARGKEPCGECHLREDETCDICGARRVATANL